ncbi:MAG TPA: hypothetical protein VJZ00_20300 [Thermoanaerobaculia bacterium]|nr:hypothetical protein [Thermoanaerobaculia bacterium]
MARRLRIQSLIVTLLLAQVASAGVIASYSFDDDDLGTGPDTFAIFEHAKGRVEMARDLRFSGYRSLGITDVAGDGDFPELQGYYPTVSDGVLRFRFAMLIATPKEPLNIALAGPNHFTMQKDGIAFWLKVRDGYFQHVTDGIPKKLFAAQAFVWYVVELRYALNDGTYDLTIAQEGNATPLVALKNQPNATSSAHSAVSMFSFVGEPFEDDSNVRYYIDDIVVATDDGETMKPFAAPGRRKLFIDRWQDQMKFAASKKGCPPVLDLADVGAAANDVDDARERMAWLRLRCESLDLDALRELDARAKSMPRATAYALASIVAMTRLGRWDDAEDRWSALAPTLRHDIRYGTMAALLGMHRENWDEAEAWLRAPAEQLTAWHSDLERRLIAEEYYFVLLWRSEHGRASKYASRMAAQLASIGVDASWWRERAADAELLGGNRAEAKRLYEAARGKDNEWSITEKLADIAYLDGDRATERALREKLYGRLH